MPMQSPWLRRAALALLASMALALAACSSTAPPPGIAPVTPFDLARYEGRW